MDALEDVVGYGCERREEVDVGRLLGRGRGWSGGYVDAIGPLGP